MSSSNDGSLVHIGHVHGAALGLAQFQRLAHEFGDQARDVDVLGDAAAAEPVGDVGVQKLPSCACSSRLADTGLRAPLLCHLAGARCGILAPYTFLAAVPILCLCRPGPPAATEPGTKEQPACITVDPADQR
jgi:hypothetical protein